MQQKLTNQLIQNRDASMKTPLPPSLAVSIVYGICPSTTPIRNKRLPLTKEIKKKKKDEHTNSSNNISSSSSSNSSTCSDRCGDGSTTESSMSAGKKTLTIDDLHKCPGCLGYFEKSVFLTHSFSCSTNLNLNHSRESNPVIVAAAEKPTSSLSAIKYPSPISISDSTDEDDDDKDSCIVIEVGNGNPARREDKTDSSALFDYDANSISLLERSKQSFRVAEHNEPTLFPITSACNLIEEALGKNNASAGKFHLGDTPATRGGHYKKPSRPCPFCGVMQAKLTRHIQLKHKEEEQVKEAMSLPPHLQRSAFNEMKKEGIRKENLRRLQQHSENGTELIKERNAMTIPARCPSCNDFFPYNLLPQHLQNCNGLVETDEAMIYDLGSKDDGDVYRSLFTEAGVNEQLTDLPTAVLKVESDVDDKSSKMVDVSSISERGLSGKSLVSVVQGIDCYKKPSSIVEGPISVNNLIEAPSNKIGLRKLKENNPIPDVCMPDVLQIHAGAPLDNDEKLSIEHCEDTVTLNLGNSGRNMNFSKGASNAIQVENALNLNMQSCGNSLSLENLQNPRFLTRQSDIQYTTHDKAMLSDPQNLEHFAMSNEAFLCDERNHLSLTDARDEASYLPPNNVFTAEHPERRRSNSADMLEESDEERTIKSKAYKKPFRPCPFCRIMQAKLTRHIKLKHKNEERVKEALKLPPHEQRFAFNDFKREGLMLENLGHVNATHELDSLNCDPVPQSRVTMTVCPYCKGSYTKDVIWEHIHNCQVAPLQVNVPNWLSRQESHISNFDMIQTVNKTVNPNFVIPPGSSLASSSQSLSISRREGKFASFSDNEEKLIYGDNKEPDSSIMLTSDKIETPRTTVPGSTNEYSKRIGYPCNPEMTTPCIKTEPLSTQPSYSQDLTKEPQNNFGMIPEQNIPGHNLCLGQQTGFRTKNQPSASSHEQMTQVVSSKSEKCLQMIDLLPFFTKKESDGSSEIPTLQENESHGVKMPKDVDSRSGEELSQTADFSLVPIKQEISADAEDTLVQVFDMRADSPVSISDVSDEDCSIVSSESSIFVPPGSPTNNHASTPVAVMRFSDKSTTGRAQMYKKPSRPCLFCGVMQAKLSRHIKLKHKDEKRVQEAMQMAQPLQRQIFNQFKKEGIKKENLRRLNDQSQPKDLIPMRTTKLNSSVSALCPNCKVSVKKDTMKEHMDICGAISSDASSSNCFQEQETFSSSQSAISPYSGHMVTGGNTFVQASYTKESATIESVSCSSFDPLPNLEVKKEMVSIDCLKNEDENHIHLESGLEIMKANEETLLEQPVGSVLFESNLEPRYCLPQVYSTLNRSQKQPPVTFVSKTNPTSIQNSYSTYCEPHAEKELQKESYTKDIVRDLYDLPSDDSQMYKTDHFKKETADNESCSGASSSLIFISDSSDDEATDGAHSQYKTNLLPSMTTTPAKHSGCSENNRTVHINGSRSYKKPSRPCPFCGIMQAKLTRHIQLKHKNEPRVRSALGLPQPYQRQAFSQFKKEGIMKENMRRISNPHNEGLISERLPPEKMLNVSCCGCGELYPRDFISKHVLGCSLAVASLGLSTASTMLVLEDASHPHMMGFKGHSKTDQKKEFVLKMRQATSLKFKDGFYEDLRKVLKSLQENEEDMETNKKQNHKNGFLEDSMKISQAIQKAFGHVSSKPIQKQNGLSGGLQETYSHLAKFVKSKLLNEHNFIHKNGRSNFADEVKDKNLPDIIPRKQNTMNVASPLLKIDLTADISVRKIRKPPKLFFKSRIQKRRSYKRLFRPCLYCGIMQAKLSHHVMLKHKKRPLRRATQVSPRLKLKAFKKGFVNKNVRNVLKKKLIQREMCSTSKRFENESKTFRLSSLADTGSGLFKSRLHFVASVERHGVKYHPVNDYSNAITLTAKHATEHLDRLKLQLPDITSHTKQKVELKSAMKEIVKDFVVQRDGSTLNAQGMDLTDGVGCLAKEAGTPAEKEPMSWIKTETVSLLGKDLVSDPQCMSTKSLITTAKFENCNLDHQLMTSKTNKIVKIPQVLLNISGSTFCLDIDHKKCTPLVTLHEVACTIPACRMSKSKDVSLNSTCLTDIYLGIDAGEPVRSLKQRENAADILLAKLLEDFKNFSPEKGSLSGKAETTSEGEVDGCTQIFIDTPKNGVHFDMVKLLGDSKLCLQAEKVDPAVLAFPVERTPASSVGNELTVRDAVSAEQESIDNGIKLKTSSNFPMLDNIPYSITSIKTEMSLPPSPISSIMSANDHSKELIPVSTLPDIAQDKLRTKQELEVSRNRLLENNDGQYQIPKPQEIVSFDTIKTDTSVEKAPITSSLDSITNKTDYATYSQNIFGQLGEEIPAGQIHRSYNFCEGANKNGRSASGGNNGGGNSGSGNSGGGGQMSSTQNSSRDSGSSTTSGRNGTGSCSFGRGGSTNRKPPTPCPFCGVRQAKLKRHIQLRHKDEERVKKALQLPANLQRDVFHQFKEEGLANERSRVKDNSGTAVSSRVGSGNRSSSSSTSSTATSSGISSGSGGSMTGSGGSSTSGRGTPTVGSMGATGVGGTPVRCSSSGSSRGGLETSKIECITSGANIVVPHDPSALKVLCPLCDTYYEKDVLQMHMIGCSSALSHFNASDWLTGPVPLGASDAELEADFLSERSSDLVHDPNQMSLTTPLLKEEYEPPIASCSVGSLSYKEFPGYMVTPQQQQQQQQQQTHHHQQHPGQNFSGPRNSFVQNLEGCQQLPPNYSLEMGQNEGPGNAAAVSNPYAVPPYGGRIGQDSRMGSAPSWNPHYQHHHQQQQMYHHHPQPQQQLLHTQHPHPPPPQQQHLHHQQQQQQKQHQTQPQQHRQPQQQQQPSHAQPLPPQQHLQPPHQQQQQQQQQHLQPPPALSQQQQQQPPPPTTQVHHQRPMQTDPALMYMKSPKQEFPTSSSSFHQQDNFMLSSSQMGSQMPDPQIHHRPPQLYSPNSGHSKQATSTASPHDYGSSMYNSPSHPQMSPSGGPGYHYTPHHQMSSMLPPSPSPKSCGNFPHIDDSGYPQMMPQHCMSDQGIMRSPPVAPHLPPPPPNRHTMMQMDVAQPHGNIPIGGSDNNNINSSGTGSQYLANRQINTGGNTSGNLAPNTASNYRSPMYHMGPGTVSPSPNSSFHHSPVASPSLSSTSSSSSKNSAPYHYSTLTSTAPGTSFSGSMYGLPDISSSTSSIGDNCRLSYDSMSHSNDGVSMSQQGHQMQSLPPQQLQPPAALPPPTQQQQQQQQQTSLLPLQSLPSLMDDPPPTSLLPSMPQMTSPRNHSASTTPAASGSSMTHLPFAGGGGGGSSSSSSSNCSNNQIDPNCIIGGSCDPTCRDGDRFGHLAGNIIGLHEGSGKDLADEINTAIDCHEDSSCGSSTTSGSGLSTTAGGADWNSCTGSGCPSGSGNNGSTPALLTSTTLDSNNASNSSGSSSCGGSSPRGYSKLRNYKKPARPCPFCGVMQAKLTRHIKLKHKEDKRVVEALGLPQPLKRQAFRQFKEEGIMKQARTSSGGPSLSSADLPSS